MIIKRRKKSSMVLNLTSMIDVVFLLLIYFMVATEFKTAEESFPMDLPAPKNGQSHMLDNEPLVIHVDSSGEGPHDLRIQLEGPWDKIENTRALTKFLRMNKIDEFHVTGYFLQTHPVLVTPTENARWEHALAVYNAVALAQYTNITLAEPVTKLDVLQ
jgi:biopolymer transport protein ExbD